MVVIRHYIVKILYLVSVVTVSMLASTLALAIPDQYQVKDDVAPGATVTREFQLNAGINYGSDEPYGYFVTEFPSMNDYGDIAGIGPDNQAATWRDKERTDLGIVGCWEEVTLCSSRAQDINNMGFVVGASTDERNSTNRYFETGYGWFNGVPQPVSWYFGKDQSSVLDINEQGYLVGTGISNQSYTRQAYFKYPYNGATQLIGDLSYTSAALAINAHREVTGFADFTNSNTRHAYLWDETNGVIDLGTLGGHYSMGMDLNDAAAVQVVGSAWSASGDQHAFLWQDGVMQDLGTLGGRVSVARAINNVGQVVGYAMTATGDQHGFIWENGQLIDLNARISQATGWVIVDAYHITDQGHILVRAVNEKDNSYVILDSGLAWPERNTEVSGLDVEVSALRSIGGANAEKVVTTLSDQQGNVYTLGYSASTAADFDPTESVDSHDFTQSGFLQKMNASGQYAWTIAINPVYSNRTGIILTAMTTDSQGDVYIAGTIKGWYAKYDFDPDPNTSAIAYANRYPNSFVAKYNSAGQLIRLDQFIGNNSRAYAKSVATDREDNLYIAHFQSAPSSFDLTDFDPTATTDWQGGTGLLVTKLAPNGDYQWTQRIAGAGAIVGSQTAVLATTMTGDIVIAGSLMGVADFDPSDAQQWLTADRWSVFVAKWNTDGEFRWARLLDDRYGVSIKTHGEDVYVLSTQMATMILEKLDTNGQPLWPEARVLAGVNGASNSGIGYGIASDYQRWFAVSNDGSVYIPGTMNGSVNFDSTGLDVQTGKVFVTKIGADNQYRWTQVLRSGDAVGLVVTVTPDHVVYLVGHYQNIMAPNENISALHYSGGAGKDIFMLQLSPVAD